MSRLTAAARSREMPRTSPRRETVTMQHLVVPAVAFTSKRAAAERCDIRASGLLPSSRDGLVAGSWCPLPRALPTDPQTPQPSAPP